MQARIKKNDMQISHLRIPIYVRNRNVFLKVMLKFKFLTFVIGWLLLDKKDRCGQLVG